MPKPTVLFGRAATFTGGLIIPTVSGSGFRRAGGLKGSTVFCSGSEAPLTRGISVCGGSTAERAIPPQTKELCCPERVDFKVRPSRGPPVSRATAGRAGFYGTSGGVCAPEIVFKVACGAT